MTRQTFVLMKREEVAGKRGSEYIGRLYDEKFHDQVTCEPLVRKSGKSIEEVVSLMGATINNEPVLDRRSGKTTNYSTKTDKVTTIPALYIEGGQRYSPVSEEELDTFYHSLSTFNWIESPVQ